MRRKGNCRNIACSESLFGSLKVERLHGMAFETSCRARDEVIDWLAWYNSRGLHTTQHYMRPMRYERRWRAAQPKTANP